ncbi:MAG: hypothetical protein ACE5HX_15470 [bacterium]
MKWVQKKVGKKVNFFCADISTPAGKELMDKYNISLNSAYLIFDSNGKEVWRSFAIPFKVRKALEILENLINS